MSEMNAVAKVNSSIVNFTAKIYSKQKLMNLMFLAFKWNGVYKRMQTLFINGGI